MTLNPGERRSRQRMRTCPRSGGLPSCRRNRPRRLKRRKCIRATSWSASARRKHGRASPKRRRPLRSRRRKRCPRKTRRCFPAAPVCTGFPGERLPSGRAARISRLCKRRPKTRRLLRAGSALPERARRICQDSMTTTKKAERTTARGGCAASKPGAQSA